MPGPLAGLRVLDLTTTFSGPYCTLLLGDLGAEVLKVEAPGGDVTRSLGTTREPGRASVFAGVNRGKHSVALNLKDAADLALLHDLCRNADALVHNMRDSAAHSLGIDYPAVRQLAPGLVYCAITGFGSDGPYAGRPAYDDSIQAVSGLAWQQSQDAADPVYMASAVADKTTGALAALSVTAALYHRGVSGHGQYVEVPMFESLASWALLEHLGGRAFWPATGPTGYERERRRRPYRTKDGIVAVVVYHDGHWRRFLAHVGKSQLLDSPELSTAQARSRNIGQLYDVVADYVAGLDTAECLAVFAELDIPAARVLSPEDLLDDPHLAAVDFFQPVQDSDGSGFLAMRPPMMFSESRLTAPRERPAPPRPDTGRATAQAWLRPS